jgi:hypothetical protein
MLSAGCPYHAWQGCHKALQSAPCMARVSQGPAGMRAGGRPHLAPARPGGLSRTRRTCRTRGLRHSSAMNERVQDVLHGVLSPYRVDRWSLPHPHRRTPRCTPPRRCERCLAEPPDASDARRSGVQVRKQQAEKASHLCQPSTARCCHAGRISAARRELPLFAWPKGSH